MSQVLPESGEGHTFDICTGTEVSDSGRSVRSYPVEVVDVRITA